MPADTSDPVQLPSWDKVGGAVENLVATVDYFPASTERYPYVPPTEGLDPDEEL